MGQNYKITLQYEGTRYDGWQKQGNTANTVQGKLEAVLSRLAGEPVEVHGSGRTDAGVHALEQVANFRLPDKCRAEDFQLPDGARISNSRLPDRAVVSGKTTGCMMSDNARAVPPQAILETMNRYLPEDIRVTGIWPVSDRFHSRLSAVKKVYRYQIETGPKRDVFARRTQYGLGRGLDVEAMKQAAALLTGTHDYKSFCGNKKMKKSTVRTVESIRIQREPDGSLVTLVFTGDGFLQHMVRIMAGTLIEVGLGKRKPGEMTEILEAKDRQQAGFLAPAEGLTLARVIYDR